MHHLLREFLDNLSPTERASCSCGLCSNDVGRKRVDFGISKERLEQILKELVLVSNTILQEQQKGVP